MPTSGSAAVLSRSSLPLPESREMVEALFAFGAAAAEDSRAPFVQPRRW